MAEHVVSPELFESVYEYAGLLESGEAFSEKNVVPETSPIISFTENAFPSSSRTRSAVRSPASTKKSRNVLPILAIG